MGDRAAGITGFVPQQFDELALFVATLSLCGFPGHNVVAAHRLVGGTCVFVLRDVRLALLAVGKISHSAMAASRGSPFQMMFDCLVARGRIA